MSNHITDHLSNLLNSILNASIVFCIKSVQLTPTPNIELLLQGISSSFFIHMPNETY